MTTFLSKAKLINKYKIKKITPVVFFLMGKKNLLTFSVEMSIMFRGRFDIFGSVDGRPIDFLS